MNKRVFISWSGQTSKAIAGALKHCLKSLFPAGDFFMSDDEIMVGDRWGAVLDAELDRTDFGIVCATCASVASHWVLFEAGSLAKSKDSSHLCILLIDLPRESLPPPLQKFQCTAITEDGVLRLCRSVQRHIGDGDKVALEDRFGKVWQQLGQQIDARPPEDVPFQGMLGSSDTRLVMVYGQHISKDDQRKLESGEVAPTVAISRLVERHGSSYVRRHFRTCIGSSTGRAELGECNVVLIGGPRSNDVTGDVFRQPKCPVKYENEHRYILDGQRFQQEHGPSRFVDYGYIMRLPNFWNEQKHLVMIAGLSSRAEEGIIDLIINRQDELPDDAKGDLFAAIVRSEHVDNTLSRSTLVRAMRIERPKDSAFWAAEQPISANRPSSDP